MYVSFLSLVNFRNYRHLDLELGPGITLLWGGNAQGKSNILEALVVLATTKSPRATAERELIHWEAAREELPYARLRAQVQRLRETLRMEVLLHGERPIRGAALSPEKALANLRVHKRLRVNDLPRRALDVLGQLLVVSFSPLDLELIGGEPSLRRRFLDMVASQLERAYVRALLEYQHLLTQRNHLLRALGEGRGRPEELLFWDERLSEAGAFLTAQRGSLVKAMAPLARQVLAELTEGQEELAFSYQPSIPLAREGATPERKTIQRSFRAALEAGRSRELAAGMTLVGPHRDELRFAVNGVDMGLYGSRGQQRTIALALRLAEATYLHQRAGQRPVLLLDDVLSELDPQRRRHVMATLPTYEQVLITTTDVEPLVPILPPAVRRLQVLRGQVLP